MKLLPLIVVTCAACAPAAARQDSDSTRDLIEDLTLLAVGEAPNPGEADAVATSIVGGKSTIEAYVDRLVADPRFASRIAPGIIMDGMISWAYNLAPSLARNTLETRDDPARPNQPVYFLNPECSSVEMVHPWWALDTKVAVCAESHRPKVLVDPVTGQRCGTSFRWPGCGCGPNLVFCIRDRDQLAEVMDSVANEARATVAYVVAHKLPIERAFVMNETVRDGLAEFMYQRSRLVAGEISTLPDYRKWPAPAKAVARPESWPGQHAGLLTTPHFLYMNDGVRDRMKEYFSQMWCTDTTSVSVTAQTIEALGVTNLRAGDGWRKLAAMEVCTNCHARTDYGMQFFAGFPPIRRALYAVPAEHGSGTGSFYGRDISDLRGKAEQNPRGFATLAVAQPEFAACMARRVSNHVFQGRATTEDQKAIDDAFKRTRQLGSTMREALLRLAATYTARSEPAPATHATLRELVDRYCVDCHSPGHVDLEHELPSALRVKMLSEVAFYGMPKDGEISTADRSLLVSKLAESIWEDPERRAAALAHYRGRESLPVHRTTSLLEAFRQRAGNAPSSPLGMSDEPIVDAEFQTLTPGLAATAALAALDACQKAGHKADALDACLERTFGLEHLVNGPVQLDPGPGRQMTPER